MKVKVNGHRKKLNITDSAELARQEEIITKRRAKGLYESGAIEKIEVGTFAGLKEIHHFLFQHVYNFAGKMRTVNIAKGGRALCVFCLPEGVTANNGKMPQSTFDEIVEKYVEMNRTHPFREGVDRSTRIWLDLIYKKGICKLVDWSKVDKDDYLMTMQRSTNRDIEIKHILRAALPDETYLKEVDWLFLLL